MERARSLTRRFITEESASIALSRPSYSAEHAKHGTGWHGRPSGPATAHGQRRAWIGGGTGSGNTPGHIVYGVQPGGRLPGPGSKMDLSGTGTMPVLSASVRKPNSSAGRRVFSSASKYGALATASARAPGSLLTPMHVKPSSFSSSCSSGPSSSQDSHATARPPPASRAPHLPSGKPAAKPPRRVSARIARCASSGRKTARYEITHRSSGWTNAGSSVCVPVEKMARLALSPKSVRMAVESRNERAQERARSSSVETLRGNTRITSSSTRRVPGDGKRGGRDGGCSGRRGRAGGAAPAVGSLAGRPRATRTARALSSAMERSRTTTLRKWWAWRMTRRARFAPGTPRSSG